MELANRIVRARWQQAGPSLRPATVENRLDRTSVDLLGGELFVLTLDDGTVIASSTLTLETGIAADGRTLTATGSADGGNLAVEWRVHLGRGLPYITGELALTARARPVALRDVAVVELPRSGDPPAAPALDGAPVRRGNLWFAVEHPMAKATRREERVRLSLPRAAPLAVGEPLVVPFVIGAAAPGQLRRTFRDYIERRRAHRHRPFLQYNSWYDISWAGKKLTAAECLTAIEQVGTALVSRRGAKLDAFVFDDGWDAPDSLWEVDRASFPHGFRPLAAAARRFGAGIGVWMSPWGGYDPTKARRLAIGRAAGYRMGSDGLALSDPRYFAHFRDTAAGFVARDRVRYLKFDGVTARDLAETEALFRLIAELRARAPGLFVNITVGTWPSPFWLWHGDSIWRGGDDLGFVGPGEKREQWMTYRDAQVYKNVVVPAPLFPLSALMTHGIVNGQHGPGAEMSVGGAALQNEVRSYFGSGVALQELYVTPGRLQPAGWDLLADTARWARERASVLADSHWVGGDPAAGEIYGWAAFKAGTNRAPAHGILVLRNPADRPATITLDVVDAFELPVSAPRRYQLASPWPDGTKPPPSVVFEAGKPQDFALAPFEVRLLETRRPTPSTGKARD